MSNVCAAVSTSDADSLLDSSPFVRRTRAKYVAVDANNKSKGNTTRWSMAITILQRAMNSISCA